MASAAGFHFERAGTEASELSPMVLLHGSGGCENALLPLARIIGPDRLAICLRGQVPWEGGYAFFRRNPDRTLDYQDLAERSSGLCGFLRQVNATSHRKPLLIGYSNGAIMAAAAIVQAPELSSGAILLRPLSPRPQRSFPLLQGYPVLMLAAASDERRDPSDASHIAEQFRQAGAAVAAHVLPISHAWHESGVENDLGREWLANRG